MSRPNESRNLEPKRAVGTWTTVSRSYWGDVSMSERENVIGSGRPWQPGAPRTRGRRQTEGDGRPLLNVERRALCARRRLILLSTPETRNLTD